MTHPIFRKKKNSKDKPAPELVSKLQKGFSACPGTSFETGSGAGLSLEKKNSKDRMVHCETTPGVLKPEAAAK